MRTAVWRRHRPCNALRPGTACLSETDGPQRRVKHVVFGAESGIYLGQWPGLSELQMDELLSQAI